MKLFRLNAARNKRFYVYSFPVTADESGKFDLTLLTDSSYYVTSISSVPGDLFHIYNISKEQQIIPTAAPIVNPIFSGNGGTPYFLPLPWELEAGTILRMIPSGTVAQVSLGGYRA